MLLSKGTVSMVDDDGKNAAYNFSLDLRSLTTSSQSAFATFGTHIFGTYSKHSTYLAIPETLDHIPHTPSSAITTYSGVIT